MEPIEAADYHEIVQVEDPRVSPDGETVAFVRKVPDGDEDYETTIWTVPVDGRPGEARQFTAGGRDTAPRWSPSGDRLAFVRSFEDDPGQLYVISTDGGEARAVTDVVGDVGDPVWSPSGDRLAFTQRTTAEERRRGLDLEREDDYEREPPDPRVIDRMIYRADARYFDGQRSHVYTVSLDGDGPVVERHTVGDSDFVAPAFGDDDTLYYAVKRGPEPDDTIEYDVDALDVATGARETVTTTTAWEPALAATEDGTVLYPYVPPDRATLRQTELEAFDRTTGDATRLTAGLDRELGAFALDESTATVAFTTPDEGHVTARRVGIGASDPGEVETVIVDGTVAGIDAQAGRIAVTKSAWDHRGDVFVTDADGDERRLTAVNEDYLSSRHVGEPEEVRIESDDGVEIQGWVLRPPEFDPDASYPLVVEIHGGPHAMWTTAGTMWHEFQTLAARGYVVYWSNPRGSTGYGEAFMQAIDADWGSVTMRDIMAGVDAVCQRPYVDEDAVFVTGGSFGGFMTGWLVGNTDRFRAAVAQRGVYELNSFYGSTDAFKLIEWDFDAVPWTDTEFLWEQSPAAHIEAVETPTLILHSDEDYRVPVNNAELFYLFLRKQGVDTRLVRYPREGHELSRSGEPAHVVDRLERIARWFDGYSPYHDAARALDRGDDSRAETDET